MDKAVFDTYEGFDFHVRIVSNGFVLEYKDTGTLVYKKKVFTALSSLLAFITAYYEGDWG